jgi:hypothetical protein
MSTSHCHLTTKNEKRKNSSDDLKAMNIKEAIGRKR